MMATLTPRAMAVSLRRTVLRRSLTNEPTEVETRMSESSFLVFDNDGGILKVAVTRYKDPIR